MLLPLATLHAGSLDADPFTLDPGFNAGAMRLDRFGGSNGTQRNSTGQKVVRLDDGSVVAAALVDAFGAETGTVTGEKNIGLVHFGANGQKIAWSNVSDTYTDASRNYVVVPNKLDAAYFRISDIQVHGSRIYVMADHRNDGGKTDVRVLAFGLDGSYKGVAALISNEIEKGIGMVFSSRDRASTYLMLVTSYGFLGEGPVGIRLARHVIDDTNDDISLDTGFRNGGYQLRAVLNCSDSTTGDLAACRTTPTSVTTIGKSDTGETLSEPYIFISGSYMQDPVGSTPAKQRSFMLKTDIDGDWQVDYGAPNPDGSVYGVATYDLPSTMSSNWPVDVQVRYEAGEGLVAFVLHGVSRSCGTGFNLVRIDAAGFNAGVASSTPFGGSDADPCPVQARVVTEARAMVLQGDRLAIVGTQEDYFMGIIDTHNAWLAVVDPDRGWMTESRKYQAKVGDDVAWGTFESVVPTADGHFIAVGSARDTARNQRDLLLVTGLRADRIFGGNFGEDRYDD
jgi:hypothetical protein